LRVDVLILGINGAPRSDGCSGLALQRALDAALAVDERIQARRIELADYRICGCIACDGCADYGRCGINDDFNQLLPILTDPAVAGVIIAAPSAMGSISAQSKAFLDRSMLLKRNGHPLRNKVGGGIAIGSRSSHGQEQVLHSLHTALLCHGMVLCTPLTDDCQCGCALQMDRNDKLNEDDLALASGLGSRVAELALRLG